MSYCFFISPTESIIYNPYSKEPLKKYVGDRLVKTICNPTEADLRDFGFLPMIFTEPPEIIPKPRCSQYMTDHWVEENGYAVLHWEIHEIPDEPTENDGISEN